MCLSATDIWQGYMHGGKWATANDSTTETRKFQIRDFPAQAAVKFQELGMLASIQYSEMRRDGERRNKVRRLIPCGCLPSAHGSFPMWPLPLSICLSKGYTTSTLNPREAF